MIRSVIEAVLEGKGWSWSVIGLIAILGGLFLRSLLLRDILRGMKIRNRGWYRRTQEYYQGRAILGWVFFLLFAIGAMLLWRFEALFLRYLDYLQWIFVLAALLAISLFLHLRAYARAIVEAVQEHVAADKDI